MNNMKIKLYSEKETTILQALKDRGIEFPSAVCGGRGRCGKCRVLLNGKDYVLACQTKFKGSIEVEVPDSGEQKICTEFEQSMNLTPDRTKTGQRGLAVDIGTTTVVMMIVDMATAKILGFEAEMNAQAIDGADVISRISFASENADGTQVLQKLIAGQLSRMGSKLCRRLGIEPATVTEMTVGANTTMLHLLAGAETRTIAVAPFVPVFLDPQQMTGEKLGIKGFEKMKVTLIGGISSYVGADITAGLYCTAITEQPEPAVFLDLGTNGEMALWTGDKLLCCSAAAGPVFEGASIHCGTGSIPGAISHVDRSGITTIEDRPAVGICGSGVIDTMALLLDLGEVDDTGYLEEDFSLTKHFGLDTGEEVVFVPKDVREVQLAKSAIFSGIQTLLRQAKLTEDDVRHVYLAGGFGTYMRAESAMRIGLLSSKWEGLVKPSGNTSLRGAMMTLLDPQCMGKMEKMRKSAQYIELSGMKEFQDLFVENMMFE